MYFAFNHQYVWSLTFSRSPVSWTKWLSKISSLRSFQITNKVEIQIIEKVVLEFFENPPRAENWYEWAYKSPWRTVSIPSQWDIRSHKQPQWSHLKNKWSLSSTAPHEAAQDTCETSRTCLVRKLSFVASLFRKSRQTKIVTFNGTALSHRKWWKSSVILMSTAVK